MNYETKTYQELRKECVARGLNGNGTREELAARLEAADGSQSDQNGQGVQSVVTGTSDSPAAGFEATETTSERQKVEREWKNDQRKMQDILESQPKVSMMIPLEPGEKPENGARVPFTVNINGYRLSYPRGVFVSVPTQVGQMIQERLESEGKIGRNLRVDADPNRAEALS